MTLNKLLVTAAAFALIAPGARAAGPAATPAGTALPYTASYADLADLADLAPLVVHVRTRAIARVEDARAPGLASGRGRFYVEAQTIALIAGRADLAPKVAFLVDLPLDPKGKPPELKKMDLLLFARAAPGDAAQLGLVAPDAAVLWTPEADTRVRAILTALLAPDAPARITGVREIVFVPGNLAGEGETQVFLRTDKGSAASLTIAHSAGAAPRWGASFSELTANIDAPPQTDTLEWYRLACFLPRTVPAEANLSDTPDARAQAERDYRFVLDSLGACPRLRRGG